MFKRRKIEDLHATELDAPDAESTGPVPGRTMPADSGLGVPPFRPVPLKEMPMGRQPLSAPTSPAGPSMSVPHGNVPNRPGMQPPQRAPLREPDERRTLVVGRGISLQGTVQDAERLVVEGTVEASMIHAVELSIAHGGVFKGEVEVEEAEIAGTIDGTLTVRANLIVRATGKVLGTARCRRLQVEDGGQITGRIEMITNAGPTDLPAPPAPRFEPARTENRVAAETT